MENIDPKKAFYEEYITMLKKLTLKDMTFVDVRIVERGRIWERPGKGLLNLGEEVDLTRTTSGEHSNLPDVISLPGNLPFNPALNIEILKDALPRMIFRRYVSKFVDFTKSKCDKVLVYKRFNLPQDFTWGDVNENDPLPSHKSEYKKNIQVSEIVEQFPLTERAKLMSNIDLEAKIKEKASEILRETIETDLLSRALFYLDILGIADTNGLITPFIGQSLAPTQKFNNTGESGATPITITQVKYDTTAGTINGKTPQQLTLQHILSFSAYLQSKYVPS